MRSNNRSRELQLIAALVVGMLVVWQLVAAFTVQRENYDGYDTIANASYFAGLRSAYIYNRSPLMGYLLAPIVSLRQKLAFHPLDMRPHHLATGILHIVYLLGVYTLLVRNFGTTAACVFAFGASIPTYIFFLYAPFISHDIIPGGVFLWMLFLADKYSERGGRSRWILLIALGAAAALIKPTYALFWFAILGAYAYLWVTDGRARSRSNLIKLFLAAIVSAAIVWVSTMAALRYAFPESSAWIKPYLQARFLVDESVGSTTAPWWLYLRNAPAYGVIPILFLIPGLKMALKGDRLHRTIALAWIVSLCAMVFLSHKEVRYLAFLAPLSAFLIVRPLQWVLCERLKATAAYVFLGLSFLPINPYSPLSEAALVFAPFYRNVGLREFLEPLESGPEQPAEVLMNTKLGVNAPGKSPLVGDPFPRLFMMSPHHIATLFGYKLGAVRFVSDEAFRRMNGWPAGTAVIWSDSHPLVKPAPWTSVFVPRADSPIWTLAVCEEVKWRAESHSTLESISGDEVKLHSLPSTDGAAWILKGDVLEREIGRLDIELRLDAPGSFDALRLVIDSEHQYHIEGATDEFEFSPGTVIRIRGFDIKRIFVPPASGA